MPRFSFLATLCLATAASLCLCGRSLSASPRDELLRIVPDDAGFCVVVRDLRDQIDRLARSPFVQQFMASKMGQALVQSPELRKLALFDQQLAASLHVTWAQLRDDIFGDAVVLAYSPGPPQHPEHEQGLLLVHARRPDLLVALFDRLNDIQKKSGELTLVEARAHQGQSYFCRQKAKEGSEFYCLRGPVLMLSDKEESLKRAIERDRQAPRVPPDLAHRLEALGAGRSLAVVWVNPKAFGPALRHKLQLAQGGEAAFLTTFSRWWDALDGVALSLSVEKEMTLSAAVGVRTEALPAAARKLLGEPSRPSALWNSFPSDALFVAAGRLPLQPLADAGAEFLTTESRMDIRDGLAKSVGALLGRDVLTELLKHLGPDWGVCVAPPFSAGKTWVPSLTAVLRLRPGSALPVEQRVFDGLDFLARFGMIAYNSQRPDQIRLQTVRQEGVEVRYLDNEQGFPPGLQPAFAWKGGYLVLASSPEAVQRFTPPKNESAPATDVPLLRVALQGWANYVRSYREPLAMFLADAHGIPVAEVRQRLDHLHDALGPFDVLELSHRSAPGCATLILRLRTMAELQSK